MRIKFPAVILSISCLCLSGWRQVGGNEDCLQQVRRAYERINDPGGPLAKGQVYCFHYTVNTFMRDTSAYNTSVEVRMFLSTDQSQIISKDIILYNDNRYSFTIIPSRRLIYWSDAAPEVDRGTRIQRLYHLQDTLLDMSSVRECSNIAPGGREADKLVTLEMSPAAKKIYGIDKARFYLKSDQEIINQIFIYYQKDNPVEHIELVYHEINYDYKGKSNLGRPAYSQIFGPDKKLLLRYQGYQVVDTRAKGAGNE